MIYDLIIIGSGPAGVTAAIYAKRSGASVLVLEKGMLGGTIGTSAEVENYLGIPNISGSDLAFKFFDHLISLEIPYQLKEVIDININDDGTKTIKTKDEDFIAKKIMVATGRKPKLLDLSNSRDLLGKGISTCATCDAMFFKGKDVAVIGGGNSAIEEALYLSSIVNKVYLISRKSDYRASKGSLDKIRDIKNIELISDVNVTKIMEENDKVKGVVLNNKKEILVQGIFMYIGYTPATEFLEELGILDKDGYVNVDENFETKIKGIYACGDVVKKKYYQIVIAAAEGAIVALNALK